MVQGLIQTFNKKIANKKPLDTKSEAIRSKNWLQSKWKLVLITAVLITLFSIFICLVIYINLGSDLRRKRVLNVHIIPYVHSDLDPYFLPGEYFENDLQHTFDYVVAELDKDIRRRFTLTETHSFHQWWKTQSNEVKDRVRKLINQGRLEIAGGWSTPDEALIHYRSFIDQYSWGLRRLEEIAGRRIIPDVSFLMDNHGHSKEIASLLRYMDVQGVMLGGVSLHEQCCRRTSRTLDFLWSDTNPSRIESQKSNLATSILDDRALKLGEYLNHKNPTIEIQNIFATAACIARGRETNVIFIPIGSHFRVGNVKQTFSIIEHLIYLANSTSKYRLNVIYSTPSFYLSSVEHGLGGWQKSNADFLPFALNAFEYWTGYYSSRPTLKHLERVATLYFQVLKQLHAFSPVPTISMDDLNRFRDGIALSQHHRAVIGVSSQDNADYFAHLLHDLVSGSSDRVNQLLRNLNDHPSTLQYESCLQLNISECGVSERSQSFVITVYNPSSQFVDQYIRIPVSKDNYIDADFDTCLGIISSSFSGESLPTQICAIPQSVRLIPGRMSEAKNELVFRAVRIPALGFRSYYVSEGMEEIKKNDREKKMDVKFDEFTGRMKLVRRNGNTYPLTQELMYYVSWLSRNSVFQPEGVPQEIAKIVKVKLINDGELVTEYEQIFENWASQIVRIYKDENFIELKWIVGPVPIRFMEGKEIITAFKTNVRHGNEFYVDMNGRGLQKRYREVNDRNPNLLSKLIPQKGIDHIPKNYRPVNSQISIQSPKYRINVFNDRVQGGTSAFEGELELMIHRRLINLKYLSKSDDLNERAFGRGLTATGVHWVFVGGSDDPELTKSIDDFAAKHHFEPWYFFADASAIPYDDWRDNHMMEFSGLKSELPKHLRILSLEPWTTGEILLRVENISKKGGLELSVDLGNLFSKLTAIDATEVTLAGYDFKRETTTCPRFGSNPGFDTQRRTLRNLEVIIRPMEIRAFLLKVVPSA